MRYSTKLILIFILSILLYTSTICCYATEDQYVTGGENRSVPTELEAGSVYNAKGNECGFTTWPGERNADWYVINTMGYDRIIFHFPIVITSDQHWIEVFNENGEYLDSSPTAELNDEFNYGIDISGNDRIYFQVLFNYFSSFNDHHARFSICLQKKFDTENWEEHSTHIWQDLRTDKTIIQDATCTSLGTKAQKECALCGTLGFLEAIPQIPHQPGDWITETEADCENAGEQISYCKMCGDVVDKRVIPATGHSFSEWSDIAPASYRTSGTRERYCEACGKIDREEYKLTPPDNLLEYGDYELIVLPNDTVRLIGYYGIDSSIEVPEDFEGHALEEIASSTFAHSEGLLRITIPSSVTEIDEGVFDGFPYLELTVARDSYAMQYAKEHNIRYIYPDSNDWLNQ